MTSVKTKSEIKIIEKACRLTDKAFDYILKKIKPGISEKELSLEIQRFIRKNGARLSFRPIIAFGKNSAEPHHKPSNKRLEKGNLVLLDFGAKVNDYCSDMTRTVFMGKASEKQKKVYKAVLEAQKRALEFLIENCHSELVSESKSETRSRNKFGMTGSEVDKVARDYVICKGYPPFPHNLGHNIGKRIHEPPRLSPKSKAILKPGMVFSIEPGIYLKNFGGIRIEDTVVLEKTGPRLLTKSTKKIIEL